MMQLIIVTTSSTINTEVILFRSGRKSKQTSVKPIKDLIAVLSPKQLLADNKRQELITKIKQYSHFEPSRFDSFCLTLILNFANYCQSLPETSNSYYAQNGGLIDHALNRTEAALELFRQVLILEDPEAPLSEDQKLWLYALFSAAILQGIGKLCIDYRIDLYEGNGSCLKTWNPLLESMTGISEYFFFDFQKDKQDDFRRRLNLLLARLLIPNAGFNWIASRPDVLAVWLALLNEDMGGAGTLGAILIRADAIAIARYFGGIAIRHIGRSGGSRRISTFVDKTPEHFTEKERGMGIEFINWLLHMLESRQILINKAPLFSVPGGLLISVEAFKWFVREHPEYKNWQAIQRAFQSLGLHHVGANGEVLSRFEQANTHQMINGVLFEQYAMALPETVQVHNVNTGKITTQSSLEFIHQTQFSQGFNSQNYSRAPAQLSHLNTRGNWVEPAPVEGSQLKIETPHG